MYHQAGNIAEHQFLVGPHETPRENESYTLYLNSGPSASSYPYSPRMVSPGYLRQPAFVVGCIEESANTWWAARPGSIEACPFWENKTSLV